MFSDRLKRYSGLIKLITALIGFIILIVAGGAYVNANLVQRETFARAKTVNFMDMLVRFGVEDSSLRKDIHSHLLMYQNGGKLATPFGPAWDYPAVTSGEFKTILDRALDAYNTAQKNQDWGAFHDDFREFDQAYGVLVQGRQRILVGVQYAAAGIIFLGFLGILALLFFRLGKADDEALAVRRENDHILASTKEGVFLIDADYQIGAQQSKAAEELFGTNVSVSGNFLDFVKKVATDEDFKRVEKFLNLIFGGRVKPRLMGDLNPLKNVELMVERKIGGTVRRILNFEFSRDDQAETVEKLLVTVSDITKEASLREELEATQKIQDEKFGLLKGILHVEPQLLHEFIVKGQSSYSQMNDLLEQASINPDSNVESLEEISRIAHRLKGDAAALRLELFQGSLHRFEDKISELREQNQLDGQSLLKLVVLLKNMIAELDLASSMTKQYSLQSIAENRDHDTSQSAVVLAQTNNVAQLFKQKVSSLADEVADRLGKKVNISVNGATHLIGTGDIANSLTEAALQLVRNAVVHGIENPDQRMAKGKPACGKLHIEFEQAPDQLAMKVTDDGQGINFDLIKQRLIDKGLVNESELQNLGRNKLVKFLFSHGFSSLEEANEDAGRGVGLDAVRSLADGINANVRVGSVRDKSASFSLIVPIQSEG